MTSKPDKTQSKTQNRATNLSLAPLSMDEAVDAIFAIPPKDVKRVLASKPERKKK